jgi:hypothetical protein
VVVDQALQGATHGSVSPRATLSAARTGRRAAWMEVLAMKYGSVTGQKATYTPTCTGP